MIKKKKKRTISQKVESASRENNKRGSFSKRPEALSNQGTFLILWVEFCNLYGPIIAISLSFPLFLYGGFIAIICYWFTIMWGKGRAGDLSF